MITKIHLLIAVIILSNLNGQVAIGKENLSKLADGITPNPNISLEFYDAPDNDKGMVLPWVSTVPNNPIPYNTATGEGYSGMQNNVDNGTIVFDLSDKKIKYKNPSQWIDLTGAPAFPLIMKDASNNTVTVNAFSNVDSSLQDSNQEQEGAKVAIGSNAETDTTTGILVLTDTNKAMVLPKVASPHLTIQNPAPGMIAYDTVKKQLAVFNGTVWSFWKP